MNKRSEEFNQLSNQLANDPLNLGRLRLLQTRLKREAVSRERIFASILSHVPMIQELYEHFQKVATTAGVTPQLRANAELSKRLGKEATSDVDAQILNAFLMFNQHTLKTNFYNKSKSSLSFRLDPKFLVDSDFAQLPYGMAAVHPLLLFSLRLA